MNRYTLHVPLVLNDGAITPADVLADVREQLIDRFGGYTVVNAQGGWQGYREPYELFHVDSDRFDVWNTLYELAQNLASTLGQEAVYLTRQTIFAALVAPRPVAVEEAA